MIKNHSGRESVDEPQRVYVVNEDAHYDKNAILTKGTRFKVWAQDGNSAIIEVLEDAHNPHCVSTEWLLAISDYE